MSWREDIAAWTARGSLVAYIDDLAGAVVEQEDALAAAEADRDAQRTRAEAAEAEVERLRAVVEGRTTAPTDAEIGAHAAVFGAWLVRFGVRGIDVRNDPDFARITRDALNGAPTWWLPLDRAGRPTAWPVPDGPTKGPPR